MHSPNPDYVALTGKIAHDQNLTWETKERLMDRVRRMSGEEQALAPKGERLDEDIDRRVAEFEPQRRRQLLRVEFPPRREWDIERVAGVEPARRAGRRQMRREFPNPRVVERWRTRGRANKGQDMRCQNLGRRGLGRFAGHVFHHGTGQP